MMQKVYEKTEDALTLHGLGFLQLQLQSGKRLHVWHPELPRRKCFQHSQIHDHRFSFVSEVLVGTQINQLWIVKKDRARPSHIGYLHEGPRTKFGNRPWLPDLHVEVEAGNRQVIQAGADYYMPAYIYHSTTPGGDGRVATLMAKRGEGDRGAHSLCAVGVEPDADFDRKQWSLDRLWQIVRDVLPLK